MVLGGGFSSRLPIHVGRRQERRRQFCENLLHRCWKDGREVSRVHVEFYIRFVVKVEECKEPLLVCGFKDAITSSKTAEYNTTV